MECLQILPSVFKFIARLRLNFKYLRVRERKKNVKKNYVPHIYSHKERTYLRQIVISYCIFYPRLLAIRNIIQQKAYEDQSPNN